MKRERLFYLDFIRAIATFVIVLTHFNALYYYNVSPATPEKAVITMRVANIYIGGFGVSLFLIVSGASLMYVYENKCETLRFYKKRFLSIYPMFWMAYVAVFLYNYYKTGGIQQGVPKINIIFSVLGIDTWLSNFGVPNFGIVGEWFLALIVMIYIVFPLLRILVNKYPWITAAVLAVMYILSICLVDKSVTLFARLPEFAFGMYIVKYTRNKQIKWMRGGILSLVILILNTILSPSWNNMFQVTYVGICSFIVLVWLSGYVKADWIKSVCRKIGKYSYACFIIHHTVIYKIAANVNLYAITKAQSWLLFGYVCMMVAVATYLLYHCHDKVIAMLKEKYE